MTALLEQHDLWLHAAGLLAGGSTFAVLAAWFAAHCLRSASAKRIAWQTALAAVVLLAFCEFTGTGLAVARFVERTTTGTMVRPETGRRTETPARAAEPASAVHELRTSEESPESPPDEIAFQQTYVVERPRAFRDAGMGAVRSVDGTDVAPEPSVSPPVIENSNKTVAAPAVVAPRVAARGAPIRPLADRVGPVLIALWLGVAALLLLRNCLGRLHVGRLQRRFEPVDDERLPELARLAQRVGARRRVRFVQSDRLSGPVTYGILRPTIALPVDFSKRFGKRQQDVVLVHELAHVASWDAAWQLVADFVTCLLWWQPLLWWSRSRFRSACESAADEASLLLPDGPDLLAECLVDLGRFKADSSRPAWLWVAGGKSNLTDRVESLLRLTQDTIAPRRIVGGRLQRVSVLMLMTAVTVTGATWLHPSKALAEKDPTMRSTWKRSLAGVTLMAALGTVVGALPADEEQERDERRRAEARERAERERDEERERDQDRRRERERGDVERRQDHAREADETLGQRAEQFERRGQELRQHVEALEREQRRLKSAFVKDHPQHKRVEQQLREALEDLKELERAHRGNAGGEREKLETHRRDRADAERRRAEDTERFEHGLRQHAENIERELHALKKEHPDAREKHEQLERELRQAHAKLKQMERAHRGNAGEEREKLEAQRRELHEKAEQLERELAELEGRDGHKADFARQELQQAMHDVRAQMEEMERGHRGHREGPQGGGDRIHHLRVAIDNLRAGGFHDAAEELQGRLKELAHHAHREHAEREHHDEAAAEHHEHEHDEHEHDEHEHDEHEGHEHDEHEGHEHEHSVEQQVGELRGEVNDLKRQLGEIRRLLERAVERK